MTKCYAKWEHLEMIPLTLILQYYLRGKKKDGISICRTSYRSDPTIDITKTEYSIA